MVSIVLPTYNGEKYIKEAIDSILLQDYSDWELIIIDDCSTDSVPEILNYYKEKDRRISVYRNKVNLKLPRSLNVGFSKAKGDYLTWTSDDNLLKPDFLRKMLLALQDNHAFVFSRMEYIDGEGHSIGKLSDVPQKADEICYHNIIGASFMYTRTVYQAVGNYNPEKFLVEDYDYWLRIYQKYEMKYIPEVLYSYRIHGGSLTESKNNQVMSSLIELFEEELKLGSLEENTKLYIYKGIAESAFSCNDFEKMKLYVKRIKKTGNMSILGKKVIASYYMGKTLTICGKKLYKKLERKR